MKNILVFATVALVVVFSAAQNRGRVCNSRNIRRPKCVPGKGGCLARVIGASYTTKQITPRGFVVSWTKHRAAICYYLEVLRGYTTFPVKTVHCYKGTSYKFTGLSPWTTYGVRVSLVNRWCGRGPPSRPVLYIKTNWDNTYVFPTKEVKTNVMTPVPGKCGQFRFTCVKSKFKQRNECIPNNKWCDRLMDCEDGSDERYCPGGCEEITEAPKNGNHSCPKFGSPGSYCFFDCFAGYVREGGSYLRCEKGIGKSPGKWSAPLPICRLPATESLEVVPESITSVSISVKWVEIGNAFQYVVIAVHHTNDEGDSESDVTISTTVNATSCCGSVLIGLSPDTEYEVTIYAIDIDGTRGVRSASLFIRTGEPSAVVDTRKATTGEATTVVVATEATTGNSDATSKNESNNDGR